MERDKIHDFGWIKIRRMVKEKNKTVTPRLAFPFCLKIAKSKVDFRKKQNCAFSILELLNSCQNISKDVSKVHLKPFLEFFDF